MVPDGAQYTLFMLQGGTELAIGRGMLAATVISLLMVPVLYAIVQRFSERLGRDRTPEQEAS